MSMMQPPVQRPLPSDVELSNTIRMNWINVARWLRSFVQSSVLGLFDRDIIVRRLYQTADEAALLFSRYYGEQFGNSIRTNYQNYFRDVESIIEAYQTGNMEAVEQSRASMYEHTDNLAALLSAVNRYWDYTTLQTLLYVLVDNTLNQIVSTFTGDYEQEVAAYDQYIEQVYNISDELTYGMIRQFRVPR